MGCSGYDVWDNFWFGGFLSHRATPSYHPFRYYFIVNHPSRGTPIYGNPHFYFGCFPALWNLGAALLDFQVVVIDFRVIDLDFIWHVFTFDSKIARI